MIGKLLAKKLMRSVSLNDVSPKSGGNKSKDFVTYQELKQCFIDECKLGEHEKAYKHLDELLEILLIKGQQVKNPAQVNRN